ncbi:hypothetical protein EPUS_04789 [Endocarpon pusillum Z07020]|uniref:N-acetyltransferase domain-containing protein n=1 Tax=Endocarpon pusillum (strain Z07020 / HMAS-L-300199) TaxID=1263415 RepID=U1GLH7_ENDPU|nr:uncharacterized protein EPUS_04789 [Endocarpon pusillum Z07020]ERF72736.1 hypothetical protein EPUS_04789 [Endocarpon pusillum Z07020]
MGVVATAGFRYSPLFRWERPYHKDYPADTILSYRTQLQDTIKSNDFIVIVAEDEYQPDENEKTEATIPSDDAWKAPTAGEKVVVGVASIKLEPGSKRKGEYKDNQGTFGYPSPWTVPALIHQAGEYPTLPENEGRDLNCKHYESWGTLVGKIREERCSGDAIMSMLVVHPAYWRRGYGTKMGQWAVELSKADDVKQCVSAAGMGYQIYSKLGYKDVCKIEASGDEDDPEGIFTNLMEPTEESKDSVLLCVIAIFVHGILDYLIP